LRKQLGFCFWAAEIAGALKGLFAAVRRSDKPCSYSTSSFTDLVYDTTL